jgi:hypothetical protein
LGAAVPLGLVRKTASTLDALDYVPKPAPRAAADELGLPAPELPTLRALYRSRRTRLAHQAWAWTHAGFDRATAPDVAAGGDILAASVRNLGSNSSGAAGPRGPRRARRPDPARAGYRGLVARCGLYERDRRSATPDVSGVGYRSRPLVAGLAEEGPITVLEWLRRPPRRRSVKTLRDGLGPFPLTPS